MRDTLKLLATARSIQNIFAPVNRMPPEIFSLISDYCKTDKELVTLTHVCHHWRKILISCASLWTSLDCVHPDKVNVYLERSGTAPLMVQAKERYPYTLPPEASLPVMPHTARFKSLTLSGPSGFILHFTRYLVSPAPLLEKLEIRVQDGSATLVESPFFSGDLPSLRTLLLSGVTTDLPWQNLSNLTTFNFRQTCDDKISVTHLLDFFERAPLLREIKLMDSLPDSSDASAGRILSLPHLRLLRIYDRLVHPILLDHLHIPTLALLTLEFGCKDESLVLDCLPGSLDNLDNISHITSISICFDFETSLRLNGPSGGVYVSCDWEDKSHDPPTVEHRVLHSLDRFPIPTIERLAVTGYDASELPEAAGCPYQALLPANNLRTLALAECHNTPFIVALNPGCNASNIVVCPKLEEFILYIREQEDVDCVEELSEMVKERASRGAKLSTVVIVCPRKITLAKKLFDLRKYVSRVEHRVEDEIPEWDTITGEVSMVVELNRQWWDAGFYF